MVCVSATQARLLPEMTRLEARAALVSSASLFLAQRLDWLNAQSGARRTERGDEANQDHHDGDDGKNDGALTLENPIALVDDELVQGDGAEQPPHSAHTKLTERAGKDADQQAIAI